MYHAVIVEDDPLITTLDQAFLERDGRFRLDRSFRTGRDALDWLLYHPADLIILDVYMPRMSGVELLRELRAAGVTSDAVMVTAANDSRTVDTLLKLGIVDYLVKPFAAQRFQMALDKFCRLRETISARDSVSQEELDVLMAGKAGASVPKGLQAKTLARVREALNQAGTAGATSETLAVQTGLSSVTVRRYLSYLESRNEAASQVNYDTGGRPSLLYRRTDRGEKIVP